MDFTLPGRVALGSADFSIADDRDDDAAIATIRAGVDAGIRVVDTARAYATVDDESHSERLVARAVGDRDDVLIVTKGGHFRTGHRAWSVENAPERLRRDVLLSRQNFGVDRLGLYYIHRADDLAVPLTDGVEALAAMRTEGLVAAIGVSNVTVAQLEQLPAIRLDAVQNRLTPLDDDGRDVVTWCERHGVAFYAYSPLGGGAGAGGLTAALPRLAEQAAARRVSVQRLALRGLLASSAAMSVIAGARRVETARDSAAAESEPWDDELAAAYSADRAARA